ncbi:hypothetical protein ABW19_dt0201596 [Dactylella cylindrospora]|nr:hypothetical protein ABW19_dt0201596 [Dactylella cylindrospora]
MGKVGEGLDQRSRWAFLISTCRLSLFTMLPKVRAYVYKSNANILFQFLHLVFYSHPNFNRLPFSFFCHVIPTMMANFDIPTTTTNMKWSIDISTFGTDCPNTNKIGIVF